MAAVVRRVVDMFGAYEVAADSLMATAPRRRDGGWDRRTRLGRAACSEFLDNQYERGEAKFRQGWSDDMAFMDLFGGKKPTPPAVKHPVPAQPKDTKAGGGGKNAPAATIAKARAANPGKRVVVAG